MTGFGRLGHFFASEAVFDIVPDIITSAKGFSSGYLPLSATIVTEKIYDVLSTPPAHGALFTTGFTYSGHPACCAAGLKNIEIMEREDICGHVRKVGPYFEKQLNEPRRPAAGRRRPRQPLHDVPRERRRQGDQGVAGAGGPGRQAHRRGMPRSGA